MFLKLVGESGCGKSTIAKLVSRFYDPTEGRIFLDGTDLRDINVHDLRSCIGVVSQEPLLFDTTIEENIRYGKPGASLEEIMEAAQSANGKKYCTICFGCWFDIFSHLTYSCTSLSSVINQPMISFVLFRMDILQG